LDRRTGRWPLAADRALVDRRVGVEIDWLFT
jgi:hypothetical protein